MSSLQLFISVSQNVELKVLQWSTWLENSA